MSTLSPLVDRQEEFALIAEAVGAAERGQGQLLLLRGEAGCGKTRLAQEAAAEAVRRGFATGYGTALAESIVPYHPWKEILEGLGLAYILEEHPPPKVRGLYIFTAEGEIAIREERADPDAVPPTLVEDLRSVARGDPPERIDTIREGALSILSHEGLRGLVIREGGLSVGAVIEGRENESFLAGLARTLETNLLRVGSPTAAGGEGATADSPWKLLPEEGKTFVYTRKDPRLRQSYLFEQVALGISRKARIRPQFLAVDDLQWADPSTLALLHYVARNIRKDRAILVGTYRVEEAGVRPHLRDALARMEQERLPAGLLVSGLPRGEMRRLAEVFLGPHALPGEFLDVLWRETQGYPLFIREVLRGLETEGRIAVRGSVRRLERDVDQLGLPRRVREAIRVRLEKLPREDRRLLDAAATCGTRFTTALLAKILGEEDASILPGLNNLVRVHGLLRPMKDGFTFDHPVVREVAYEGVPADARRDYHLEAAQWLELVGGPVEDVAEHYYLAQDVRAIVKLTEAAKSARARYANSEGLRYLDEVLTLMEGRALDRERLEVLEAKTDVLRVLGDWEAGQRAAVALLSVSQELHDLEFEAKAHLVIGSFAFRRGKWREAIAAQRAAFERAKGLGNPALEAEILLEEGFAHERLGAYSDADTCFNEALARGMTSGDAGVLARANRALGILSEVRGRPTEGLAHYEKALALLHETDEPGQILRLYHDIAVAYHRSGDYSRSAEMSLKCIELARRTGDIRAVAYGSVSAGSSLAQLRDFEKASSLLGDGLGIFTRLGETSMIAAAHRDLGILRGLQGRYEIALKEFEQALEIYKTRVKAPYYEAYTHHKLGQMYAQKGNPQEAIAVLENAVRIYSNLGSESEVREVREEIRSLQKPVPRR